MLTVNVVEVIFSESSCDVTVYIPSSEHVTEWMVTSRRKEDRENIAENFS